MATANRQSTLSVAGEFESEPHRFEFFQAVRLLRKSYTDCGRLGIGDEPLDEPVRFRSHLSLNFPASEIHDVRFQAAQPQGSEAPRHAGQITGYAGQPGGAFSISRARLTVSFMGLVGPLGVLPRPYTELLQHRHMQYRDDAAHDFLDIFGHRMVALFYQGWQKYRFHIEYERSGHSPFTQHLLNLSGLGTPALQWSFRNPKAPAREHLFAYFSGLLSQKPRNLVNLQALLQHHFGIEVRVTPFTGRWLAIAESERTALGRANSALGHTTVAGRRAWDYQSKFTVTLGPLALSDYLAFLPGKARHAELLAIIRFYVGSELDFAVRPVLRKQDVPRAQLTRAMPPQLGRLAWLNVQPPEHDAADALFHIDYSGDRP